MTISQETEGDQILSGLLGSETRAKILKTLILNDKKSFRLIELSNQTGLDSGGIHREISNLVSLNLAEISRSPEGTTYNINKNHILFQGLLEIFKKSELLSKQYFLFEEMPIGYPLQGCTFMNANNANTQFEKMSLDSRLSKTLSIYEYPNLKIFFYNKEFRKLSKEVLTKIIKDPQFGIEDAEEVIRFGKNLLTIADEIEEKNYGEPSIHELGRLLKKYFDIYKVGHISGWTQNLSDAPDMQFTKHLISILQEKVRKKGSLIKPQDAFSKLTTPSEESFMQKEHEALLNILIEINENPELKETFRTLEPRHILKKIQEKPIGKKLQEHTREYGWLGYGWLGPNWNESYFIGILSSLLRQKSNPRKLLEESRTKKQELKKEQESIITSLEFDDHTKKLFKVARGYIFSKGFRKDAMIKFLSRIELFYQEIARRLHISITDIRFCFPHEFDDLIKRKPELIKKLQERQKFSICESKGTYEEDLYLTGEKAKNYLLKLNFEKEENSQVSSLDGTCACPGRVRGKAKIINLPSDMSKMEEGNILVSIATSPDLVPAMKKAAAIVTDMGGITSHAAIVSRELNVPCVVGTKVATKALKDGMLIEVDATHGTVKVIED